MTPDLKLEKYWKEPASILSKQKDGLGFYYGNLPCGRQLNVRQTTNRATGMEAWDIWVGGAKLMEQGASKADAERIGAAWAAATPENDASSAAE
jgi:hypothetical protein